MSHGCEGQCDFSSLKLCFTSGPWGPGGPGGPGEHPGITGFGFSGSSPPKMLGSNKLRPSFVWVDKKNTKEQGFSMRLTMKWLNEVCLCKLAWVCGLQGCHASIAEVVEGRVAAEEVTWGSMDQTSTSHPLRERQTVSVYNECMQHVTKSYISPGRAVKILSM